MNRIQWMPGGQTRCVRGLRRLAMLLVLLPALAASGGLPSIAVLDFELIDEQQELAPAKAEYGWLDGLTEQVRTQFDAKGLYRTVDLTPARPMIEKFQARQNLRECNGCELDIGRALNADRVLLGWVQKVSNLILNINIRIEDVSTGRVVLQKSVDIRGNTEDSWRRGVDTLVRDMLDRGQVGR